jgi:hypothetical protein
MKAITKNIFLRQNYAEQQKRSRTMCRKKAFTIAACTLLFLCSAAISANASGKSKTGPFGVFFAMHMEVGTQKPEFLHQEQYWPRVVQMISISNRYDAKITLLFNPQWATYILMDQNRFDMVKKWQRQGHEIGLHYHLVTHNDWCGYTNRNDAVYIDSPYYQGNVADMMQILKQLAAPEPVLTGCCGGDIATKSFPYCKPVPPGLIDEIDFPNEIIYDIDGIFDGRTNPIQFEFNGKARYHLRHGIAIEKSDIEERLNEMDSAECDEIVGFVTHESDYDPQLLKEVFQYLKERQIHIQTVRHIMKNYLE